MFTITHLDLHTQSLCIVHIHTHEPIRFKHACTHMVLCICMCALGKAHIATTAQNGTYVCPHVRAQTQMQKHARLGPHMRVCAPTYAHVCMFTPAQTCTRVDTHTSICTYVCIRIHWLSPEVLNSHTRSATCPHSHTHNQMPISSHIHTYMPVFMHTDTQMHADTFSCNPTLPPPHTHSLPPLQHKTPGKVAPSAGLSCQGAW